MKYVFNTRNHSTVYDAVRDTEDENVAARDLIKLLRKMRRASHLNKGVYSYI